MPRCYKLCKYNVMNYCEKYNEPIVVSKNIAHYGLLFHPLEYLTLYYNENEPDVEHLIKAAEKYLKDNNIAKSVCEFYRKRGYITFKQRKLLLHIFFDCYEGKTQREDVGYYFAQVED